jgi:sugar lactone lactonase YvrE
MRHRLAALLAAALTTTLATLAVPVGASAHVETGYDLPESGVFLEGIGVDPRSDAFYVSATNRDGTIYRGTRHDQRLQVWVSPHAGDNGRGIMVDNRGRVYVAGGPAAEVRVFDRAGTLLAELPTGLTGSFLNDVWVGPDGAAYVTDSSLPIIWRVTEDHDTWSIEKWRDVSPEITYTPSLADFDLGGIVTTRDDRALLVAQGTTGQLWRVDLRTKAITQVDLGGATVVNADGLVLDSRDLYVVQNFSRQVSKIRLSHDATSGTVTAIQATPADRTFTTAKRVDGRLLAVDSKFGFAPAAAVADDRVVALRRF